MQPTERGFSLIELMIAVSILGVLGHQYASFASQREKQMRLQSAQHDGKQLQSTLLSRLRKDLQSRPLESQTTVLRQQIEFVQESVQGEFLQVKVISRCRSWKGNAQIQVRNPSDQECYQNLNCQGLPYVEWSRGVPGQQSELSRFPSMEFQTREQQKKSGVVGLGLCLRKQSDRLEAYALAFIQTQDAEGQSILRIEGLSGQMPLEARNSISFLR